MKITLFLKSKKPFKKKKFAILLNSCLKSRVKVYHTLTNYNNKAIKMKKIIKNKRN